MDQHTRPSAYLVERCRELGRVLEFFLAPHHGQMPAADERLVVFLSQLDFWDWEIDNLIHAFATFSERARAWEETSGPALADRLHARGLPVRFAAVKNLRERRLSRADRARQVVAPADELARVVGVWNTLLETCERRVLVPEDERRRDAALGSHVLPDLGRFRKSA